MRLFCHSDAELQSTTTVYHHVCHQMKYRRCLPSKFPPPFLEAVTLQLRRIKWQWCAFSSPLGISLLRILLVILTRCCNVCMFLSRYDLMLFIFRIWMVPATGGLSFGAKAWLAVISEYVSVYMKTWDDEIFILKRYVDGVMFFDFIHQREHRDRNSFDM